MNVNWGNKIYTSKFLKRNLEFISDNGSLFAAGTSLALATVARPISIYATPKTDKENKKLACAKSIASSAVGFCLMLGASLPIANSVKNINKSPEKYLKPETIKNLKDSAKPLINSKGYQFTTQLFKLGVGAAAAIPKALVTCALIPPIMSLVFKNDKKQNSSLIQSTSIQNNSANQNKTISFTGRLPEKPITKGISTIINSKKVQDFANKYKDTNYAMHIAALTDTLATGTFIVQTQNSKKIEDSRKRPLMYNAGISTGICIGLGYITDKLLNKPTEKFINKFKEANKTSPKLEKYVEGIRIAKPTLILGGIYYCIIPLISTFFAERIDNSLHNLTNKNKTKMT